MNFVAGVDSLAEVEAAAPAVLAMPSFDAGSRYEDYEAGDLKSGYGVAALVAGGTGAVLLKKTGLIAILLIFLKKGWIVIVGVGAWLFRKFRKSDQDVPKGD